MSQDHVGWPPVPLETFVGLDAQKGTYMFEHKYRFLRVMRVFSRQQIDSMARENGLKHLLKKQKRAAQK